MLSKKDLIEANKMFHTGKIANEGSLDFAVTQVQRSKNWLKTAAILSHAIITDHVFEDGNKRTAAGVIAAIMELNGLTPDLDKLDKVVLHISRKNIHSIPKIARLISHARK